MRIGLITSNHTRHRFVAKTLQEAHEVVLVLTEEKRRNPADVTGTADERELAAAYFHDRTAAEEQILPEGRQWSSEVGRVLPVPAGGINDRCWPDEMRRAGVDLIAVFGSSILREPWLDAFPNRMVNLHLGLSPYYRGAATNFWPLYDAQPEYVGATIHLINAGVDTGPILQHARPRITAEDTPHTIGNQAVRAGAHALSSALRDYAQGWISPVPQWEVPDSRYFRGKDFNAAVLRNFLTRWQAGLLPRALVDYDRRRKRVRLIREFGNE